MKLGSTVHLDTLDDKIFQSLENLKGAQNLIWNIMAATDIEEMDGQDTEIRQIRQ